MVWSLGYDDSGVLVLRYNGKCGTDMGRIEREATLRRMCRILNAAEAKAKKKPALARRAK